MTRQRTVSEAARARGATGFLKSRRLHRVRVGGGVGLVYEGHNAREAGRAVERWRKFAAGAVGRAAGQTVSHFIEEVLQPEPPAI